MNIREIRVGNWLKYKGHEVIWEVEDFEEWGKNIELLIEPIPLTEDWLFKFGFTDYEWCNDCAFMKFYERHLMMRYYNDKWYCFRTIVGKDSQGHSMKGSENIAEPGFIKYVHQAQNLIYALTSQELTIKQ